MCHEIHPKDSKKVFIDFYDKESSCNESTKAYIGSKYFLYNRRWGYFAATIQHGKYNIIKENGQFGFTTDKPISKQPLLLSIPIRNNVGYSKAIDVLAGIHIHPFNEDSLEYSVFNQIFNDLAFPVIFYHKDIVFYDGTDVSVKKFFFLTNEQMTDLLKDKHIPELYEKFLSKVSELIARR